MTVVPRSLLCRPPLLPGESLYSYLNRVAAANAYPSLTLLTRLCQRQLAACGIRDNLERPHHPATFALLAQLTGCSPQTVLQASVHYFAQSPLVPPSASTQLYLTDGTPFFCWRSHSWPRYVLRVDQARYCPVCLGESPYHRQVWGVQDVYGCVQHGCLLLDCCPQCQKRLHIQDIVKTVCPHCKAQLVDMTGAASIALTPFAHTAQRLLQQWWGVPSTTASQVDLVLPQQSSKVLYQLLNRFSNTLKICTPHSQHLTQSLAEQFAIQVTAFQALANWPLGFLEFLRGCLVHEVLLHGHYYGCDFSQPVQLRAHSLLDFWSSVFSDSSDYNFVHVVIHQFLQENGVQQVAHYGSTRIQIAANAELQAIARPYAQKHRARVEKLIEQL